MVIELRVVQFWSEIIPVISNRTSAARLFDFEITRMTQTKLHSTQFNYHYKSFYLKLQTLQNLVVVLVLESKGLYYVLRDHLLNSSNKPSHGI